MDQIIGCPVVEEYEGIQTTPKLGSIKGKCELCSEDVWIGPASQKAKGTIICLICVATASHLAGGEVKTQALSKEGHLYTQDFKP